MIKRILSAVAIAILLSISGFFYLLDQNINQQLPVDENLLFTIQPGESLNNLSKELRTQGLISTRFWLRAYVRLNPDYSALKQGTYQISAEDTLKSVLTKFVNGAEHQFSLTLIEGLTLKEWLVLIDKQPLIKKTKHTNSFELISQYFNIERSNPEGWFFPDTYAFTANTTDIEILARAHEKMSKVLRKEWDNKSSNLPYKSAYEALIMASIIEKETGKVFEQSRIASVFVNRMNKKMRLQTDPTVIYGLGDRFQGNITRKHLREKTAYNTYRINGLPPTPIAMPGLLAIKAALHPEESNYFYFVSKGDGTHQFSSTLSAHNQAVAKYQLGKN